VLSGGSAVDIRLEGYAVLRVSAGGSAVSTTVSGSDTTVDLLGGVAVGDLVEKGGTETVNAGGSAVSAQIDSGGAQIVSAGGSAIATSVAPGGTETVAAAGKAVSTFLTSKGGMTVASNGVAIHTSVASSSTETVLIAAREPAGQNLWPTQSADGTRRLLVAVDGTQVAWITAEAPTRWQRFDASRLDLDTDHRAPTGLADWADAAGTLRVSDWDQGVAPKLNDRILTLDSRYYERSYSVAVAPDRLLVGTGWFLRLFDASGRERWHHFLSAAALRVNQSADGRIAVGAYGDGTIRWHRLRDGAELLTLFVW